MDWIKLKYFYAVAKAGNFTKAAQTTHVNQSTISRAILDIEQDLGVILFHRNNRGVTLTKEGTILLQFTNQLFIDGEKLRTQFSKKDSVQGEIKLVTSPSFASTSLIHHLIRFMQLYSEVNIDLMCDDRAFNLNVHEFDVMIGVQNDSCSNNIISTPLCKRQLGVFASPGYLAEYGTPHVASDLDQHRLLVWSQTSADPLCDTKWLLEVGSFSRRTPFATAHSTECLVKMAEAGLGIITLCLDSNLLSPALVRLLPTLETPSANMCYFYSRQRGELARIISLRDFLKDAYQRQAVDTNKEEAIQLSLSA